MTFSLHSMIRMLMLLVVGMTIVAVGVSRLDPPRQVCRYLRPATSVSVNDFLLEVSDREPRWIDPETGKMKVVPLRFDGLLEAASCSPWVDDSGKRQIVGRWSTRENQGPKAISTAFGLGRYSFPDGELIDQIPCETVPVNAPCWYPGTRARILFSGGDGELHQFAFEGQATSAISSELTRSVDLEPTTLTWACPKPGLGDVFVGDTSWPTDPRLGGRLIVSMRIQEQDKSGQPRFSRSELWWLKLDAAGNRVIEAGPLIDHDLSGNKLKDFDERSPAISGLPDGSLALAYDRQSDDQAGWSVYLARIATNERGELIPAPESQSRPLEAQAQPAQPSFSADGRWISILVKSQEGEGSVVRLPTVSPKADLTRTAQNLSPKQDHQVH